MREANQALLTKVNCETFDAEIAYLKEILAAKGGPPGPPVEVKPQGPGISTKDLMMLRDLGLRLPELEKSVRDLI